MYFCLSDGNILTPNNANSELRGCSLQSDINYTPCDVPDHFAFLYCCHG